MRTRLSRAIFALWTSTMLLAGISPVLLAAIDGDNSESITSTATSVTFSSRRTRVFIKNDAVSANEVYLQVYWCGETITAVTTTTGLVRLEPNEAFDTGAFDSRSESGIGYCGFSVITAATETATIRWNAK